MKTLMIAVIALLGLAGAMGCTSKEEVNDEALWMQTTSGEWKWTPVDKICWDTLIEYPAGTEVIPDPETNSFRFIRDGVYYEEGGGGDEAAKCTCNAPAGKKCDEECTGNPPQCACVMTDCTDCSRSAAME